MIFVVGTMDFPESIKTVTTIMPSPFKAINSEEDKYGLRELTAPIFDTTISFGKISNLGQVECQGRTEGN
jgi:hypothetical protein